MGSLLGAAGGAGRPAGRGGRRGGAAGGAEGGSAPVGHGGSSRSLPPIPNSLEADRQPALPAPTPRSARPGCRSLRCRDRLLGDLLCNLP
ncbi:hypothetical protein Q9966_010697 [Columba livia]|nr:hypothetical protein Q9966_010697 [Columba livia]